MLPVDALTPVCPLIAPMHHSLIAPALNCSHHSLSISTLSLATAHLACTVFHYTALAGFLGPPQHLHILLLSPPQPVQSACSLSYLSVHHVSGSVNLYYCNVPAWLFLTSLTENKNLNIQLTLASNQTTALTMVMMMTMMMVEGVVEEAR